jgi:uncharacterized protein (TIRG00374 family)
VISVLSRLWVHLWASKYFRLGLGLLVSAGSLYLALRTVTLSEVWAVLARADGRYVGLALIGVVLNPVAKAVRWKVLIGPRGRGVSFWKAWMSLLAGQALNTLYPARLGDLSRVYVVGGLGPGRVFILGTIVVEKVLDMLSYALLFGLLLLLIPLPGWVNDSGYTFVAATLLVSLALIAATLRRDWTLRLLEGLARRLPARLGTRIAGYLDSAFNSLDVLQDRWELLKLALLSIFIWYTAVLNIQLVLLALGLELPLTASLLILIGLQAGIAIPSVPARIGIFEYICVLSLALFGIDQGLAFSFGLLLHGVLMLPPTLFGVVFVGLLGAGSRPQVSAGERYSPLVPPSEGT